LCQRERRRRILHRGFAAEDPPPANWHYLGHQPDAVLIALYRRAIASGKQQTPDSRGKNVRMKHWPFIRPL
jgi:hypothetical protein